MSRYWIFLKALSQQAPKATLLVVLLSVLAAMVLTWQAGVYRNRVMSLQEKLHQAQLQLRQHREVAQPDHLSEFSVVQQMKNNKARIDSLVPPLASFSEFLKELFTCAADAGVEITQVSYHPDTDDQTGYWRYHFSFSITSEYRRVKKFLFFLEQSPRLLCLEQIGLSGGQTSGG